MAKVTPRHTHRPRLAYAHLTRTLRSSSRLPRILSLSLSSLFVRRYRRDNSRPSAPIRTTHSSWIPFLPVPCFNKKMALLLTPRAVGMVSSLASTPRSGARRVCTLASHLTIARTGWCTSAHVFARAMCRHRHGASPAAESPQKQEVAQTHGRLCGTSPRGSNPLPVGSPILGRGRTHTFVVPWRSAGSCSLCGARESARRDRVRAYSPRTHNFLELMTQETDTRVTDGKKNI